MEHALAVFQNGDRVLQRAASLDGVSGNVTHRERAGFALRRFQQLLDRRFVPDDHLRAIEQVVRRIATDDELGRQEHARAVFAGPLIGPEHLLHVGGEGPDYRINLSDGDFHRYCFSG